MQNAPARAGVRLFFQNGDLDPPVSRLVRLGVVRGDRFFGPEASRVHVVRVSHALGHEEVRHGGGPFLRKLLPRLRGAREGGVPGDEEFLVGEALEEGGDAGDLFPFGGKEVRRVCGELDVLDADRDPSSVAAAEASLIPMRESSSFISLAILSRSMRRLSVTVASAVPLYSRVTPEASFRRIAKVSS